MDGLESRHILSKKIKVFVSQCETSFAATSNLSKHEKTVTQFLKSSFNHCEQQATTVASLLSEMHV